ncbi:MAG: alpha-amylase family glycosyl hydrolase, partial [Candidatus Cryptobacteroides sp.]
MAKNIIYQMLPRLWRNSVGKNIKGGTLEENGTGKFADIDNETLEYLKWLGCSHLWLTGVIRHSTKESCQGCIPSNPQFVKGRAGSPYAITDYYDVNPYLASDPDRRMDEFRELVDRIHAKGLKVVLDFIPNHVSRDYGKTSPICGHPVLGENDDKTVHWSKDNDFFYYPGEKLTLPVKPEGEPYCECPAMATGNNCYTSSPGINDWYETIKINYCDTHTATWDKMYDVIRFWASQGVDGFRCDMVELVPQEFMKWLIAKAKEEFPQLVFIAEVYQKDLYRTYVREVGFDLLYDKSGMYDTIRTITDKNVSDDGMPVELWQSATGITRTWQYLGDLQPYMLNFLENHDEQRFASDFFGKDAKNSFAALAVSLFFNRASFMLYFGEEVGEKGMDNEGFSGTDGRTTIFDWWAPESVCKLVNLIHSGKYMSVSDNSLTAEEKIAALMDGGLDRNSAIVFEKYANALRFAASDPAIREGTVYDLCYCNSSAGGFDKDRHFAFLRDK